MSVFLLFNTKYYQVYIVNPMTITPYSISESTKISEAYLNNMINENLKNTISKGVGKMVGKEVGKRVGKDAAKTVSKEVGKRVGKDAAKTVSQGHVTMREVLDNAYSGMRKAANAGMKVIDGAATGAGKLMAEHPGKTALVALAASAPIVDQVAFDSKYTDLIFNRAPNSDKQAIVDVSQQNINTVKNSNEQKDADALADLNKAISTGRASHSQTNATMSTLNRIGVRDPNDVRLRLLPDLRNALIDFNKRNATNIQESDEGVDIDALIRRANDTLDSRQDIPKAIVPPTTRTAMDKVTTIYAKGEAERQNPNTKIDPSDQSWSANAKDFVFDNPYLTASMLTLPVLAYIIAKHGAPLIDAIKRKGDNAVSGKEFVIVDNGKYLHSNGFSETISKDIAIFKNRADAQSAINALNAVTKSNYKIEELSKVIG